MTKEEFIIELQKLNIVLTEKQLNKLEKFYELLIEWNNKINLTTITNKEDVYLKHFYDSLTIVKAVALTQEKTLCDVGTGAGFPGIVLKICYPNLKITLLDALEKRVTYLNDIIKKLNLKDIKALHERGEFHKGKYDIVTARAVANMEKLITYTMPLVNKDGLFVAMKGNISKELTQEVTSKIEKKYHIVKIEEFTLPKEESIRSLVIIKNK